MAKDCPNAVHTALQRILRPLIRLLLKSGVSYVEFADIAKRHYVDIASRELRIPGRKVSVSRAAVLTGLSRKEVQKLLQEPRLTQPGLSGQYNRAARVIAGWVRDREFHDADSQPKVLPFAGEEGSFSVLVRRYSGDIPPRAILDELVRVGAVQISPAGDITLLTRAYVPQAVSDKVEILGTDVAALIDTISHNLEAMAGQAFYQRKVMYDHLSEEATALLRPAVAERGQQLLEEFDRLFAAHDRDATPDAGGSGRRRAGVGIYYFENDPEQDEGDPPESANGH